jgi:hypothetical protein
MTQSDEPPRAAVETLCQVLRYRPGETQEILRTLRRRLPDAELWPLIAWLAQGREPTEAMLQVLAMGCAPNRVQGFQYGDELVIRDVWQPVEKQVLWRGPADPREEGKKFSTGPLHDAFIRQCEIERARIAFRAMLAAAAQGGDDAKG